MEIGRVGMSELGSGYKKLKFIYNFTAFNFSLIMLLCEGKLIYETLAVFLPANYFNRGCSYKRESS